MRCRSLIISTLITASPVLVLILLSASCSSEERAKVVPVAGKVLLDGEALKFGTVTFQPPQGQPARGDIEPDGTFTLSTYRKGDGAAVGRHKVRITCYTSQDPQSQKQGVLQGESLGESLIPERYTRFDSSGLEVAVLEWGSQPIVFELVRDPPDGESDSSEPNDIEHVEEGEFEARPSTDNTEKGGSTASPQNSVDDLSTEPAVSP